MKATEAIKRIDSDFAKAIAADGRIDLFACYQCQKCTNGCPVTFAMDYGPHEIIRMLQLGLMEEVGQANTAWMCASCETCFTRCPQQIDIPALMDYLRQWILREHKTSVDKSVAAFHQAFLDNIRKFGRVNETVLMAEFQFKSMKSGKTFDTKEALKNLQLGVAMFKRGRLSFVPKKTGGKNAVRKLYQHR